MGSPAELTLGCRPSVTANSSAFKTISLAGDQLERMQRLEEHLKALEDEQRKIDAFKRELPLCMQLLTDAIGASKDQLGDCQASIQMAQQLQASSDYTEGSNYRSGSERPLLEEFIPLKKKTDDSMTGEGIKDDRTFRQADSNKLNWMSVSQLWNEQGDTVEHEAHRETEEHDQERDITATRSTSKPTEGLPTEQVQVPNSKSKLFLHSKQRMGGAFLPFSRERQIIQPSTGTGATNFPDLALSSGDQDGSPPLRCEESGSVRSSRGRSGEGLEHDGGETLVRSNVTVATALGNNLGHAGSQSQRKARRCWSPELHRRFVNALQQLGGSQVATPKQIRELMKVDGLTNDEVKSHLQKYRLHTRRPSPAPQSVAPHAPQLVVLGGIWVPPDYAVHAAVAAQQGPALYNSAQQPHLGPPSLPQDFYSQINSPNQLQLHPPLYYDQQRPVAAHSGSSPEGPLQFTGQSSGGVRVSGDAGREESVGEDGKTESSTWKGGEQEERMYEDEENGGQSGLDVSPPSQQECRNHSGQNDSDTEDSRGSETRLKF